MAVKRLVQKYEAADARMQQSKIQPEAASAIYHSQRELATSLELANLHLADHPDVAREYEAADARMQQSKIQPESASAIYHSQRELATSLELAYLHLADHPDVAREVRMTAHTARSQHRMTSSLVKKFSGTADLIINTMIPILFDAIDLKSPKIIEKAFARIIEQAQTMKMESETTFASCMKLQKELQENQAAVEKTAGYIKQETTRLESEIQKEQQMENDAHLRLKQLEKKKKQLDESLQSLTKEKDQRLDNANNLGLSVDAYETFLDSIRPGGRRNGLFKKFLCLFRRILNGVKKEEEERLMKEYRDVKNIFDKTLTEKQTVENHMKEAQEETHQRHAKMKDLRAQQDGSGNIDNIREASKCLGQMDSYLSIIIQMWDEFVATLNYLNERIKAGDMYMDMIEEEKFANRFRESISRAEEDWQLFAKMCNGYVEENEEQINTLYGFLLSPIDSMSESDRSDRKKKLRSSFKSDSVSVGEITVDSDSDSCC